MNYQLIITDFLITFVAFTIFPFIRFYKKKNFYTNNQIRNFNIINSIIIQSIFLIILLINKSDKFNFVPALVYFCVNQFLWNNRDKEFNEENIDTIKFKRKKGVFKFNNKFVVIFLTIIVAITCIIIVFMINNNKIEQIKLKQKQEEQRQINLEKCISNAKVNRTNLWNSNCEKQSNGNCTIQNGTGTIEWIEQRYQQDLNNCYKLYK